MSAFPAPISENIGIDRRYVLGYNPLPRYHVDRKDGPFDEGYRCACNSDFYVDRLRMKSSTDTPVRIGLQRTTNQVNGPEGCGMIEFSFLLPTRGRVEQVQRFLASLVETAEHLERIEVILCVDADDTESHHIELSPSRITTQANKTLAIKTVIVPAGLTMGALNRACFDASSGRYVMLINDDVVARSQNWDTTIQSVFRGYEDDILLVHVNDLLFRDKLCTFPILSRRACLEIGLCPVEYQRYRLDDHIFDTYCMLAHLGHKRIIYLSDVVFEHRNHSDQAAPHDVQLFTSIDNKVYLPNPEIMERDASVFDARLAERKQNAVRLANLIDQTAVEKVCRRNVKVLEDVVDARALRRPENIIALPAPVDRLQAATVTVAVVTADLRGNHTRKCLDHLKRFTSNVDLLVLDNSGSSTFNHPHEMNKVLQSTKTDFVVLMDDDVFVEPNWLPTLLRAMDEKTGVVVPMHKDEAGALSFSGVYLMGDDQGTHAHLLDVPDKPRVVQCVCSALLLIDRRKCGHVLFNEEYRKYFLDIDYSLRIWETGHRLVCSPNVTVTHVGGATMPRESKKSQWYHNTDLAVFMREWVDSRRLARVEEEHWNREPALRELCEIPRRIRRLTAANDSYECTQYERDLKALFDVTAPFPLFRSLLKTLMRNQVRHSVRHDDSLKSQICRQMLDRLAETTEVFGGSIPQLIGSRKGYNLVGCGSKFFAVPLDSPPVDVRDGLVLERPGILSAGSLPDVRGMVDARPLAPFGEVADMGDAQPPQRLASRLRAGIYLRLKKTAKACLKAIGFEFCGAIDPQWMPQQAAGKRFWFDDFGYFHVTILNRRFSRKVGQATSRAPAAQVIGIVPALVHEGYQGFNIVEHDGLFYGIEQSAGPFSMAAVKKGRFTRLARGSTPVEVKAEIDRLVLLPVPLRRRIRHLARRSSRLFLGAPHVQDYKPTAPDGADSQPAFATATRAPASVSTVPVRSVAGALRNDAANALVGEFDVTQASHTAELVQKDHAGFDIFYFNTKYFGVRTGLAAFDLQQVQNGEFGPSFVGNTIQEVLSEIARGASQVGRPKALVVCTAGHREFLSYLPHLDEFEVQLLVTARNQREFPRHQTHAYANASGTTSDQVDLSQLSRKFLAELQDQQFDVVILLGDRTAWRDHRAERLAMALSVPLTMIYSDGRRQNYKGEDLHRITYNAAYLNSLFRFVPNLSGMSVLDVGCSDGLVCNLLLNEQPDKIVGIDILETVGCRYSHPQISYHRMDATRMQFPDRHFDLCVSIATFEHVPDPPAVFREMKRVTASGGYCYVQAGPLYHSPFGHHMFGYFDELPWIHLRRSKADIVSYARMTGVDRKIQETFGKDITRYVDEMINREHVNQKFLREYGIDEFLKAEKCERVFFNQSREGESLINAEVLSELGAYSRDDLIAHGFELLFRVP